MSQGLGQLKVVHPEYDELTERFGDVMEAVKAVRTAQGNVAGKWRDAADEFYAKFIVPYYDFEERAVSSEARTFIERATGGYKEAAQDKLKLAVPCRYFFGGKNTSRQDINRLAMLGAAGAHYGKAPSEVIDTLGEGNIDTALREFRKIINPETPEEMAARETARREKAINHIFEAEREDFLNRALSDPGIVRVITQSFRGLLPDLVGHVVTSGTVGRTVDGVRLSVHATSKGGTKKAEIDEQFDRIGIADGEIGIIRVKRVGSIFEPIWSEMPSPEHVPQDA